MLTAALVSAGLVVGMPVLLAGAMGAAILEPRIALALGAAAYVASRHRGERQLSNVEGTFHQAVTAELRSGASLRSALARATGTVPALRLQRLERAANSGLPINYLQQVLLARLPNTGRATAAALAVLEETGGHAIPTFEGLALIAQDVTSIERDRRVSTAQVRMSALVIAGLPLGFLTYLVLSGRFGQVAERAPVMLMAGGAMLAIGVAWMGWMLRPWRPRTSSVLQFGGGQTPEADLLLPQLVLVGLTAGLSLEAALLHAEERLPSAAAQEVDQLLRRARHSGMASALSSSGGPSQSFLRVLARSYVTGAPMAAAVAVFLSESQETYRTEALTRARRLSVKLLVPLALFMLPGFVFLTVGPAFVESATRVLGPLFP